MDGKNISGASKAVYLFARAAESLGIKVSIIDFVGGNARYAKPAVMPAEIAKSVLLSKKTAGGTPLSDALEIARSTTDIRTEEPLIVCMTDGKAADTDAVIEEIKEAHCPVCSITLAFDHPGGELPERAEEIQPKFFRTTGVHEQECLLDSLDEFASLLTGL
jgi:hypothetical protein